MPVRRLLGGGVDWSINLERDRVVPGTVVRGRVVINPSRRLETRGCIASLIGTEQWKYQDTERDAQGNTQTVVRTRRQEARRLPVALMAATTLVPGNEVGLDFEVPVPPLGPATFEAEVARMTWQLELKLDMAGGLDPSVAVPIVVLQPTGLLSAGVVNTGQWGLWEQVEGSLGEASYKLALKPVPLCIGQPFSGRLELDRDVGGRLREVRLELKVHAEATVSRGLSEDLVLLRQPIQGLTSLAAGAHELSSVVPETWLPSVDLPHGRGRARLEVIGDRPWAPDDRLVREVALCSTREV